MFNKLNKKVREGFTLVEILIVVVIIGILAAIAVPAYLGYMESGRASAAHSYIRTILDQSKLYVAKGGTGTVPSTVDEMISANLLDVDQAVLDQWTFSLELDYDDDQNKVSGTISAISTSRFEGGEDKEVCYDIANEVFGGYGSKLECGESNWQLKF